VSLGPAATAMELAAGVGAYGAGYLSSLLAAPAGVSAPAVLLTVPGVPPQTEVDRLLSVYEACVTTEDLCLEATA